MSASLQGNHLWVDQIARLVARQEGVVARSQALELGMTPTAIARAVRRREWVAVHRGVYVEHTGPLTWQQRAWAAVLCCWPAALTDRSAMGPHDGAIHVAVDRDRHREAPDGVVLHRVSGFAARVQWNLGPPRIRLEDCVLDLAAGARDDLAAVAVLADACGSRRTTVDRLMTALAYRPWFPRRAFVEGVLRDVASGTCSVLEHGYLDLVERPHGLPVGARQVVRIGGGAVQDVAYDGLGLLVELDGRLFHSSVEQRDRDLDRDLDHTVERDGTTLRLGYGQVFRDGCPTAAKVAAVMHRLGWTGEPTRCGKCGGPDQPG